MMTAASLSPPSGGGVSALLKQHLSRWKSLNLSSKLDDASQMAREQKEQREASKVARSTLADTTKQFKKSVKSMDQSTSSSPQWDQLSKECRVLVKSYQEEIDNLTKRCKSSEGSFSTLQTYLNEVSDPTSVLEQAMAEIMTMQQQKDQLLKTMDAVNREMTQMQQQQQQKQAETAAAKAAAAASSASSLGLSKEEREELVQLRREVAEYEVEFRSLKNQDITIRKLEAKIASLEESATDKVEAEVEKLRAEVQQTEGLKAAEALEREATALRKLELCQVQLQAERAAQQATQHQMEDQSASLGTVEAAWEAQRTILVQDSERLREQVHVLTRERDELALQVAAQQPNANTVGGSASVGAAAGSAANQPGTPLADMMAERQAYEAEVSELSHMANALREELRLNEEAISEERESLQNTVDEVQQQNRTLQAQMKTLEQKLAVAPSQSLVDSMKHELRILKRLEYNAMDDDEDDGNEEDDGGDPEWQIPSTSPKVGSAAEDQELEKVLVKKLRRVESELVRERNAKVELSKMETKYKEQIATLEQAKQDADRLVASLESDLEKAIPSPKPRKPIADMKVSPPVPVIAENPALLGSILDPNAPAPPKVAVPDTTKTAKSSSTAEKAEDDHSVATIIMAQRDRLRVRCDAMEAERDSFKRELQAQVAAMESLKADNTKLYEKVRYLQNYKQSSAMARSSSGSSASRDLDLEALEQRYEASVDPFRQFSRAERQRKLKEMSPMERIVFVVAKTVLGSKEMRTALFFYVLGMHLLVFMSTMHWSHSEDCGGSHHYQHHEYLSNLPPDQHEQIVEKYAQNMAAINGTIDLAALADTDE